jgi:hypothetical protein
VHARWFILTQKDGSVTQFAAWAKKDGAAAVWNAWPVPTAEAWAYIVGFGLLQAVLMLAVPGREFKGPVTPKGNVPVYKVCSAEPCVKSAAASSSHRCRLRHYLLRGAGQWPAVLLHNALVVLLYLEVCPARQSSLSAPGFSHTR